MTSAGTEQYDLGSVRQRQGHATFLLKAQVLQNGCLWIHAEYEATEDRRDPLLSVENGESDTFERDIAIINPQHWRSYAVYYPVSPEKD